MSQPHECADREPAPRESALANCFGAGDDADVSAFDTTSRSSALWAKKRVHKNVFHGSPICREGREIRQRNLSVPDPCTATIRLKVVLFYD
jgi:hypothetical protein